jgi:acyl carrier protein
MEELIKILEAVKPGYDYKKEKNLIDDEILSSYEIVAIVAKINKEFDVEFPVEKMIPENFNSAEALYKIVEELIDE